MLKEFFLEAGNILFIKSNTMISFTGDFSILIQGKYSAKTYQVLREFREAFPDAEIILSVWEGCVLPEKLPFADKILATTDPGTTQIFNQVGEVVHTDNSLRQFVSTYEAFKAATKPIIIKWRSDATFNGQKLKLLLFNKDIVDNLYNGRVLVSTFLSLDANICSDWKGHISDWFYIGKRESFRFPSKKIIKHAMDCRLGRLKINEPLSLKFFGFPTAGYSAEQLMTDLCFDGGSNYFNGVLQTRCDPSNYFIFVSPSCLDLNVRQKYLELTSTKDRAKLFPSFNGFSISEGVFVESLDANGKLCIIKRVRHRKIIYLSRLIIYKTFLFFKIIKLRWLQ